MSFADVQSKTTLTGFSASDQATILAAMRTAYEGSATARAMFDDWIAVPGRTISINFLQGKFGAGANTGELFIDLNNLTSAMYINNNGTAVKDTAVTAIVHELVHALTGRSDNRNLILSGATNDYRQPTVTFSNVIYRELGLPEQNSYIAYDDVGDILTLGFQYTNGAAIDRSFVRDDNWDSSAAGNSNDLLIGGASGNVLRAGDGNDFLYGNAGNDTLDGGKGNDTLIGGGGNDTYKYNNGDGLDTILDSDGQGAIVVDGNVLSGGAQYGDGRVFRGKEASGAGADIEKRKSALLSHRLERQQFRRRQFQRSGQAADIDQRDIALPAFHSAQIAARHTRFQCQRLLRPATRLAQLRQTLAEQRTGISGRACNHSA